MVLDDLKRQIERLEGRQKRFVSVAGERFEPWATGIEALDEALPNETLAVNACHEFTPFRQNDVPHVAGFIWALLQCLPKRRLDGGLIVWCQTAFNAREYGRLYAPALIGSNIGPERFLFVSVPKERDLALVLEECVRTKSVAAVIGEGPAPDFTASRRLTLAAQVSRVPCLILNTGGNISASSAETRWRVAPIAGPPDPDDPKGPGKPAWSLTLARSRGGNAARNPTLAKPLDVYWNNETHSFDLVSSLRLTTPRSGTRATRAFSGGRESAL